MFLILGLVFAGIAALIHVVIFRLESIVWSQPATWKRFGLRSQQDADVVKPMALNQGFYNLFLAIGTIVGIVLVATGAVDVGRALVLFATLSMVAAASVLIISNSRLAQAAITQGAAPLVAVVLLLVSFAV